MPLMQSPPGPVTRIDGRECLYFVGTGYLGFQGRSEVVRAACEAAQQYGIGSANSRTAFGTTPPVLEVERLAAEMFDMDDAFYYASGWMGNNILLQSLDGRSGPVFVDECSHYSAFEAARLCGQPCAVGNAHPTIVFRHRAPDDLQAKINAHLKPGQSPLVLSDGVFAATGKIAPVEEYCEVLKEYPGAALSVDDAHGLAVLGENGCGTFEYAGVGMGNGDQGAVAGGDHQSAIINHQFPHPSSPPSAFRLPPSFAPPCPALLFSGTLSKAVGGFGGIIPGSRDFIEQLKRQSPYFGGASPPPPPIAAATARALELVMAEPELRTRLWSNVRLLKDGLRGMGFDVDQTPVPIVCLTLGMAENMRRIQQEFMARGIAIAYMAAYSGLGVEGGLRIAVFATHTEEMIGRLLDELKRVL
jgi:8-amino-7-oxononanoate synthase